VIDAWNVGERRLGLRIVVLRQAFDLLDVEHCVALEKRFVDRETKRERFRIIFPDVSPSD
jgi:hypothetical protein